MRIAHVTATFPPYPGGTGNVCFDNARGLARRGHDVHVLTATLPGTPALEWREGITIHRLRHLVRVGNAPVLPALMGASRGFDIIHLHCPFILGAEMVSLAAALHKTRLVVTYHNDLVGSGGWRDVIFYFATWSARHAVLYRAHRVLFVSHGHAETSKQRALYYKRREHSLVLENGVDVERFSPEVDGSQPRRALGIPADAPVVGFIGALDRAHHYKGLGVLLNALASPELGGTFLLVVGDGDLEYGYRQQARRLGIGARVLFCGSIAQEALPPIYGACDVVCIPSLVPEALPLTLLEAFASGVPVVASDNAGVRSVLGNGEDGLLVAPGDVSDLARKVRMLLRDPEQRRRMGQQGRAKCVARYSAEGSAARLESIYYQVLGEPVSPRSTHPHTP